MNRFNILYKKSQLTLLLFALSLSICSQTQKDTIDTQVVKVVTAYTPSISDAFKIRENPEFQPQSFEKKKLNYQTNPQIISSDFTPSLGGYIKPPKKQTEKWFENYLKLGYGNFNTPLVQTFLHKRWKKQAVFLSLDNLSSDGNIKDIIAPSAFGRTYVRSYYTNTENKLKWLAGLRYNRETNHWYGLDQSFYDRAFIQTLDLKQQFQTTGLFGEFSLDRSIFKKGNIEFDWFTDKFDNSELHINVGSNLAFELFDKPLKTYAQIQLVNGTFSKDDTDMFLEKNYHFAQVSLNPKYQLLNDKFQLNLGIKVNYLNSSEEVKAIGLFPDISAKYGLNSKTELTFGMLGGQTLNSYKSLAQSNPFIAPHILLKPTQTPYHLFVGLKGNLSKYLNYQAEIGFKKQTDQVFFVQSPITSSDESAPAYWRGNGLLTVYDDLQSTAVNVILNSQPFDQFEITQKINYQILKPKTINKPWLNPNLKTETQLLYKLSKWQFELIGYYVGERNAFAMGNNNNEFLKLNGFFDLNTRVNYKFNPKFSAFIEGNNILNQNYQRFAQYPVQGFQILGGFVYHFNI